LAKQQQQQHDQKDANAANAVGNRNHAGNGTDVDHGTSTLVSLMQPSSRTTPNYSNQQSVDAAAEEQAVIASSTAAAAATGAVVPKLTTSTSAVTAANVSKVGFFHSSESLIFYNTVLKCSHNKSLLSTVLLRVCCPLRPTSCASLDTA
jgi:hypothetical protein